MSSSFRSRTATSGSTIMASQSQGRGRSSQKRHETVSEPEGEEDIEQSDQSNTDEPIRANGDYTGSTDVLQQGSSKAYRKHHRNALAESSDESVGYTPPRKKDKRVHEELGIAGPSGTQKKPPTKVPKTTKPAKVAKLKDSNTTKTPNPGFKLPLKKNTPVIPSTDKRKREKAKSTKAKQTTLEMKTTKTLESQAAAKKKAQVHAHPRQLEALFDDIDEIENISSDEEELEEPAPDRPDADRPGRRTKKSKNRTFVEYSITEEEALTELEAYNRQHYCVSLNKEFYDGPATTVLKDMPRSNPFFKNALKKTCRDYKNWKGTIIKRIRVAVEAWAKTHTDCRARESQDFSEIKELINADFEWHWLDNVFPFISPAIDFDECSELGMNFLQYAYVQLMTHARMTTLFETHRTIDLMKYNMEHFKDFYDGLYKYKKFKKLSLEDFPMRSVPRHSKRSKRMVYNPNDDSDGEVDETFFKAFHL